MSAPPVLAVFVAGRVTPQGSKNRGRGGRSYEASKHLRPWRDAIIEQLRSALPLHPEFDRAAAGYAVELEFTILRPKRHHVACDRARPLRDGAPSYCPTTPDVDKASRAVLDALTQADAIPDDRLVVVLTASKTYSAPGRLPGVHLTVTPMEI